MDDTNEKAFYQFLDVLREVTENDTEVIKLIEKRYTKANPTYTTSSQFLQLLRTVQRKVQHDAANKYIFVKELTDELKAYDIKHAKKHKRKNLIIESDSDSSDTATVSVLESAVLKSQSTMAPKRSRESDSDNTCSNEPEQKRLKRVFEDETVKNKNSNRETRDPTSTDEDKVMFVDFSKESRTDGKNVGDVIEIKSTSDVISGKSDQESVDERGNIAPHHNETGDDDSDIQEIMDDEDEDDDSDFQTEAKKPKPSTSKSKGQEAKIEEGVAATKNARKIRKYQIFLDRLDRRIKKLDEKEISLDDMKEDSNYLIIDKLKKTFVKHWTRLCELQARNPTTGRPIDKKFKCTATRFPEINKRIQKFVNKKKIFPDYCDVRTIVQKCNVRYKLGLGKGMIDVVSRDAFTDVGNRLQKRRLEDYDCAFGSHLTDSVRDYDDPALFDVELRRKLESNQKQSKSKLDELIKKFAYKQETEADKSGDEENDNEEEEAEEEIRQEEEEKIQGKEKAPDDVIDHDTEDFGKAPQQPSARTETQEMSTQRDSLTVPVSELQKNTDDKKEKELHDSVKCEQSIQAEGKTVIDTKGEERATKKPNYVSVLEGKDAENIHGHMHPDKSAVKKKIKSKYVLDPGAKTISLKDILGGPTITKEDLETSVEEELLDQEYDENPIVDSDESITDGQELHEHVENEDHDDDVEILSSSDDDTVAKKSTVAEKIFLTKKPVDSPVARAGLSKLKQLKQPVILQQVAKEHTVDSSGRNKTAVVGDSTLNLTSDKNVDHLSGEEDNFVSDYADLGCSPLDPKQTYFGTPFARARRLNNTAVITSQAASNQSSQLASNSPKSVASEAIPKQLQHTSPKRIMSCTVGSPKEGENVAQRHSFGKDPKSLLNNKPVSPKSPGAQTVSSRPVNSMSPSASLRHGAGGIVPRRVVPETLQTNSKLVSPRKQVDEGSQVVILDDDFGSPESVIDLGTPSPSGKSSQSPKYVDRPKFVSRKELHLTEPSRIVTPTSNYSYKKVHTVVKQTSVSSSSSSNPQKETVVRSSSKTIIRKIPVDASAGHGRKSFPSHNEKNVVSRPRQHSPGQHPITGGHSTLSGFKLTRRKTNNKSNISGRPRSSIADNVRKEVHNVVAKVLEERARSQSPKPVSEDEPIVLDSCEYDDDRSARKSNTRVADILSFTKSAQVRGQASSRVQRMVPTGTVRKATTSAPSIHSKAHSVVHRGPQHVDRTSSVGVNIRPQDSVRTVDHSVGDTKATHSVVHNGPQQTVRKTVLGDSVRSSIKTIPHVTTVSATQGTTANSRQASFPDQRHRPRIPLSTLSESDKYADSVISSSEQPPDLGEPDCVIILSDSD